MLTSKARALVEVFSIYDPTKASSSKYHQVQAPKGGDIRHPSVRKNMEKDELMELVRPLFFPGGMNSSSLVNKFNNLTDIHGMQLIHDMIKCLLLKHPRCYLLSKDLNCDSSRFI